MNSIETRLLSRLEIKFPVKKPTGNSKKYRPNSVAGRCKYSDMSDAEADAIVIKAPVVNPLCSTKAAKRICENKAT